MTFDPNMLNALLALDDRALWQTIRSIAAAHGIALPEGPMAESEMRRLRAALSGATQADVGEALRIVTEYGKRGR